MYLVWTRPTDPWCNVTCSKRKRDGEIWSGIILLNKHTLSVAGCSPIFGPSRKLQTSYMAPTPTPTLTSPSFLINNILNSFEILNLCLISPMYEFYFNSIFWSYILFNLPHHCQNNCSIRQTYFTFFSF